MKYIKILIITFLLLAIASVADAKGSSRGFGGGKSSYGSSSRSSSSSSSSWRSSSNSSGSSSSSSSSSSGNPFSFFSNSGKSNSSKQSAPVSAPPLTAYQQANQQKNQGSENKTVFSNFFRKPPVMPPGQTDQTRVNQPGYNNPVPKLPNWETRRDTFRNNHYVPPYYNPSRYSGGYGGWDKFFLGYLVSDAFQDLGRFFYNHSNDPDVNRWKADLYREANNNADLKARLDKAEKQVADLQAQNASVDPSYIPPGIDKDIAMTPATASTDDSESSFLGTMTTMAIIGALIWFVFFRRTL